MKKKKKKKYNSHFVKLNSLRDLCTLGTHCTIIYYQRKGIVLNYTLNSEKLNDVFVFIPFLY